MLTVHLPHENLLLKSADKCFMSLESLTNAKCETNVKRCMLLTFELSSPYYWQTSETLQSRNYPFPVVGDDFESNWPERFDHTPEQRGEPD